MSYATLLRGEPHAIAFGVLYTVAATVGQTFLISLFLPGIKGSLGLGDAQVSLLFTATTLASAVALWKIGSWIDRTDLVRYAVSCGVLLAASCALIAVSPVLAALVAGMFGLRLAGNGLLMHVAITATTRYFTTDRGQALSLVLLGSSIGEATLPAVLVPLIGTWGWRWTLVATGLFGLVLVIVAGSVVRKHAAFRAPPSCLAAVDPVSARDGQACRDRDQRRYFAWTAPLFAGMWMITTATIFHQALLAQAKSVSLQWFAVSFVVFAIVRVPVSVFTGRLVDRMGSAWLFCMHLLPLAAGVAALIVVDSPWVVPLYWLCAGITGGMGAVLQSTIVAERVPAARLGRARSILGAVGIVASAAGPSLYGAGLAAGASIPALLWASVGALVVATALGAVATRNDAKTGRDDPKAHHAVRRLPL